MCYTGRCKYEEHTGECSLGLEKEYPEDAACEQDIREMDEEPEYSRDEGE